MQFAQHRYSFLEFIHNVLLILSISIPKLTSPSNCDLEVCLYDTFNLTLNFQIWRKWEAKIWLVTQNTRASTITWQCSEFSTSEEWVIFFSSLCFDQRQLLSTKAWSSPAFKNNNICFLQVLSPSYCRTSQLDFWQHSWQVSLKITDLLIWF